MAPDDGSETAVYLPVSTAYRADCCLLAVRPQDEWVARATLIRSRWRVRLVALGDSTRRREAAFQLVLPPALIAVVIVGQAQYELFTDSQDGLASNLLWALFVVVPVFLIPFIPIAIALFADWIGSAGALAAFATGLAALVAIPWLVQRAIANDSSSSASLIHIYDPLLMTFAVAVVVGIGAAVRRVGPS